MKTLVTEKIRHIVYKSMSLPMVFGFIMKVIILLALVAGAMASPAKYSVIRDLSKYQDRSVLYPGIFKGANKLHRPNLYSKIVGGEEAVPHSYPFIVGMFIDDMYFCGGSILNENWILTASHCMDGANTVEVIAGAHNIREDEPTQQKMVSSEYTVHEGWTNNLVEGFDVTVIKLPQPLEFNENVQPITRTSSEPAVGDLVTAIGWGKPSDSAAGISDTLNMVDKLDIIDRATCGDTYGSVLSEDIICISAKDGRGTCNGDSGGPLVDASGNLAGVTSFGASSGCELGFPDGYSSVAKFNSWIDDNIEA